MIEKFATSRGTAPSEFLDLFNTVNTVPGRAVPSE